jgi:hypothetical protein
MSRKKPKIISTVKHPRAGMSVNVYLNQDSLTFSATVAGEIIAGTDGKDVERRVFQAIAASVELDWQPVIEARALHPFTAADESFVGIEIDRYYVAVRKTDGLLLESAWSTEGKATFTYAKTFGNWSPHDDGEWKLPCNDGHGHTSMMDGTRYFMAYTDELWAGLEQLIVAIRALRARLDTLLATVEGQAMISTVGAQLLKMLPAPDEDAQTNGEE